MAGMKNARIVHPSGRVIALYYSVDTAHRANETWKGTVEQFVRFGDGEWGWRPA